MVSYCETTSFNFYPKLSAKIHNESPKGILFLVEPHMLRHIILILFIFTLFNNHILRIFIFRGLWTILDYKRFCFCVELIRQVGREFFRSIPLRLIYDNTFLWLLQRIHYSAFNKLVRYVPSYSDLNKHCCHKLEYCSYPP
jgi:hypothetical protein